MRVSSYGSVDSYLSQETTIAVCEKHGLPCAPVLYQGPFKKEILDLRSGNSTLTDSHIREGIVIQPRKQRTDRKLGRVILKKRSEDFLMIE